jgi:hypothetical protein
MEEKTDISDRGLKANQLWPGPLLKLLAHRVATQKQPGSVPRLGDGSKFVVSLEN